MTDGASISPARDPSQDTARGPARDRVRGSARRLIAVIGIAAAIYLLGNDRIHLWDRDEPRYAQTSRQMLQSGDWVVPRFLGEVRTAKPVLIYWCQAGVMSVLGDTPFAARLPSAIAMVLTLAMLAIVLWKIASPEHAFWSVTILASSFLVVSAAKMCITDAVLLLWITMGQLCLYAMWRGRGSWPIVLVYAVSMGLALLTKGPVILGVQGMTVVGLGVMWFVGRFASSRAASTPPLGDPMTDRNVCPTEDRASAAVVIAKIPVVVAIVFAIVAPWVYLVEQRAPGFLRTALFHDVLERMHQPLEGHKGPPGFYLATILGTYLPWSIFLPTAIGLAIVNRRQPLVRFALASVVGPWVMFEIVRTKLPHYLLPVFPWLALLTADALIRCFRGQAKLLFPRAISGGAAAWALAIVGLGAAPWLAMLRFDGLPYIAMGTLTVVAALYAGWVFALMNRQRLREAAMAMASGMSVVLVVFFGWYLPRAWFCQLPEAVAAVLQRQGASKGVGEVIMIDYKEPSLAFYQGGAIREERRSLALIPFEQVPPWVVISGREWAKCAGDLRARFKASGPMRAWTYADRGRVIEVYVLRKKG